MIPRSRDEYDTDNSKLITLSNFIRLAKRLVQLIVLHCTVDDFNSFLLIATASGNVT